MSVLQVHLQGDLRRFQPDEGLTYHVGSIRELMRALESQLEGFREYLTLQASKGANYQVIINGDRTLGESQLEDPVGDVRIDILPVIEGSGKLGRIIAGVALIGIGIITGGIPGFLTAESLILTGTTLALGGFAALFNPPKNKTDKEEDKSFIFNGASNVSPVNSRIPIILGAGFKGEGLVVGSLTASASIRSFQINNDKDDD